MEMEMDKQADERSSFSSCITKCRHPFSSTRFKSTKKSMLESDIIVPTKSTPRKPGGWKSVAYILGNETFERLASIGLVANLMVYLQTRLHMELVYATNLLNIWSGLTNFAPLIGAFISDAYVGRFRTIAFASFASLLGMATLTLTAWMPQLHPPPCTAEHTKADECVGATKIQLGIFLMGLGLLTVGTGGIRPCSIPFGVDQFDPTTDEGRKGITSFFNWYYTTFTIVLMIALTLIVYIQDTVSWVLGFGLPTVLMVGSIVLFFLGTRLYVYVKPEGSVFASFAQVMVAAFKKRKIQLTEDDHNVDGVFYDPPFNKGTTVKLPFTKQFRFLNKAAKIEEGDVKTEDGRVGAINKWKVSSIQEVEELKCILRVCPIWAAGVICFTSMAQQGTFTVAQALKMDRHLGPHFQIPPGSLSVISMLTLGLFVPIYDRLLVPFLRRITKIPTGITLLQRMGIGMVFSILSMVVAGFMERERRNSAVSHALPSGIAPMSVLWLAPQLILMGFAEAFNIIGQIEFYNREFPEHMRSIANSLFFVTIAGANYLSSVVVTIVHGTTGKKGVRPDWLTKNINEGRVDYFYYLIAVLGVLNMICFYFFSQRYWYKDSLGDDDKKALHFDVELNSIKSSKV